MPDWTGVPILITGAAGFLAANLVHHLVQEKAQVHALVRPESHLWRLQSIQPQLQLHRVSLSNRQKLIETVRQVAPKVVFHLAAGGVHHRDDQQTVLRTNVFGTLNLLEALESLPFECMVATGGSSEYGPKSAPMKENDLLEPASFYGVTKAAETLLCQQYARARQRPLVILRPFSIYGPWEGASRLIPTAIRACLLGIELPLTAGTYNHDFVYVADVVQACLLAARAPHLGGEIINIAAGEQWSNQQVIAEIERITGRTIRVRAGAFPARQSDTSYWVADIDKAKRLLGWEPATRLPQGLEKTIAWFRANLHAYA
jgi:nucleoside-diphosphate-sugar epimerase